MAELTSIAALVSVVASAAVSVIAQIQHSRCTKINACCVTCERTPPPDATHHPQPRQEPASNTQRRTPEAAHATTPTTNPQAQAQAQGASTAPT